MNRKRSMRSVVISLISLYLFGCAPDESIILIRAHDPSSVVRVKTEIAEVSLEREHTVSFVRGQSVTQSEPVSPALAVYVQDLVRGFSPPSDHFVLYFETGSSQLIPDSEHIVLEILNSLHQRRGAAEIEITGHTDRVGSLEINDSLSQQRAETLKELLFSRGVFAGFIRTVGRGEREPLVPTEDEVSESRNRRVDVIVR